MSYEIEFDVKQVKNYLARSHDVRIQVADKWISVRMRGDHAFFAPENCQESIHNEEHEILCWLWSIGIRKVRLYANENIKSIKDESNFSFINGEKCVIESHPDTTGIYRKYYNEYGTLIYAEQSDAILRETMSSYFRLDIEAGIPEDYYILQGTRSVQLISASIQRLDVPYLVEVGHRPIKQGIIYKERPKIVSGIYKI